MHKAATPLLALAATVALASPLAARDSLGMFGGWGAFRDPAAPRCYAIAKARDSTSQRDYQPYATVATWPKHGIRGQVHFRLSRKLAAEPQLALRVGSKRFTLTGGGADAWAADKKGDAAIVAAMRSATTMTITARDARGRRFANTYDLDGAATAMDSATVGCAKLGR